MENRFFILMQRDLHFPEEESRADGPPDVTWGAAELTFFLAVSALRFFLHLYQCEGYMFLHCSPIALEKYDRAKNKGKRFTEPSRSQLIEAAGKTPRVLLLRSSDMQRHLPIKHSVLTPEIKHLYWCSENAFHAFLSLTLCLNSSFLKYNFSLRT